jgi:hypothetical protein
VKFQRAISGASPGSPQLSSNLKEGGRATELYPSTHAIHTHTRITHAHYKQAHLDGGGGEHHLDRLLEADQAGQALWFNV